MFLPEALDERKKAEERRKKAFRNIEMWGLEMIPPAIRDQAVISASEVVCGDPECSPIDTNVCITFQSGVDGFLGIPSSAHEVTKEELASRFPSHEILQKWHNGVDAEWPPIELDLPQLRFDLGTRVLCRIGPDVTKDWAPGTITQLWYSQSDWPEGSVAPYKVKLDDGRQIFAPGDIDQVIRKVPEPALPPTPTPTVE